MRFLTVAVTVLMLAACASAADVDGKWSGTVSTPNGDIPQAFTFKAAGATLNGAMAGPDGKDVAIKDGKVDGNNISFTVTLDFAGMPIVLSFKGAVEKTQIKLMGDFMGMPFELVVKKSS